MKKKINKTKWKYGVLAIVFSLAFVAPGLFQFVDFGTVEKETQPESWFDPRLSAFLYDDEIDEASIPFNAYGESYIVCNVTDIAYTNFSITATGFDEEYDVSYGTNYIPVNFGEEEKTFTVTFEDYTKIDWFVVEPVIIAMDSIDIDLDATPEEISFDSGGLVSFLVIWNCTSWNNFTYDELYVEYDGIVINEIETGWDPSLELDPSIIAKARFDGIYLQYDIYTEVGSHTIKLKGNDTVDYIIVVNGDYDGDGYGNTEEIQMDPLKAGLWYYPLVNGYFLKGTNYKVILDVEKEYGTFVLNIPEYFSGRNVLRMKIYSGALKNITIDNNDIRFKDISTDVKLYDNPQTLYYGNIEAGNHIITWNYAKECIFLIGFFINGTEVFIDEVSSVKDSDCDGIPDQEENSGRSSFEIADSDNDGILDGYDLSPMTYLTLNNSKITEITIPTEDDTDTMISLSIKRPVEDFTTNQSMIWNDMNVQILPLLRVFGNSTIGKGELIDTYEKNIESYDLTDSNFNYGDAVPDIQNENAEYTLIKPLMSNDSIGYNLFYNISNSAKDDLVLNIRFDFVWGIISTELDIVSIVHFYDIDEPIILQSLTSIEMHPMDYALASPDSMVENEIIYNLVQNPSLGTFSDFGMTGDVVGSGSTDFYEVLDTINTLRESNPISVDENGNIDETEVIYLSFDMSQHNVLRDVTNMLTWTNVPDIEQDYMVEYRVANYIVNPSSESDLMPFSSNVMSGDNMKILYTKEYGNYSDDSPLEKRLHIIDYPIFMRNQTFTDGDVLEVTYSATRDGIPLDQLPETIESTMSDKIIFSNKTLIENKVESVENSLDSVLSFDLLYDIEKTAIDTRILEVPLSNLVFNSYSRTWVSILVDMMSKRMSQFLVQQGRFGGISNLIPLSFSYNIPNDVLFQCAVVIDVLNIDELLTKRIGGVFSYWEGGLDPFRQGIMIPDSSYYGNVDPTIANARFIPTTEMMNMAGLSERVKMIAHYRAVDENINDIRMTNWRAGTPRQANMAEGLAQYSFAKTDMYSYTYHGLAWAFDIETLLQELRKPTTIIDLAVSGLDGIDVWCITKTDILNQLFNKFDPSTSLHMANLLTEQITVLHEWEAYVLKLMDWSDRNAIIRASIEYTDTLTHVMEMYKDVDRITWGDRAGPRQVAEFGYYLYDKSEAAKHVGMWIQTDIDLGYTGMSSTSVGVMGLSPERIQSAIEHQQEFYRKLQGRYMDHQNAFNIMQAQINEEKLKLSETVRQVKLDLETKAKAMLKRQIINERAKKLKRAKVFYGIICAVLIFTALLDFGAAIEANEEGDIANVIYRTISGTSKLMLAICLITELVIRGRILKHLGNELVMKVLNKQLLKTGVYISFLGLAINLITLPEVWTAITESNMDNWQKNLLYGLLIAALIFDGVAVGISIAALYGTVFACTSWIPYVGLIIEAILLICFICFYPEPETFEFGGADYEDSGFEFLNSNLKKNGGIRVGETVDYYYEGSSLQESGDIYMQARLNPNNLGYSDWDGEYVEHSGYEYEDPIYISTGKTLTATNSCLSIDLDLQMSVDFDGEMEEAYDGTLDTILGMPVMNENIEYFYGNLTINPNDENMLKYRELKNGFIKYKNTYEYNKTAEYLDKLSTPVEFDFLEDNVGEEPDGWDILKDNGRFFETPTGDDNTADVWYRTTMPTFYEAVNDSRKEENHYPYDYISWDQTDFHFEDLDMIGDWVVFDFRDDFDFFNEISEVTVHVRGRGDLNDRTDLDTGCEISWNGGIDWSSQLLQDVGDQDGTWALYSYNWDSLSEDDFDDFQIRLQAPSPPPMGTHVEIDIIYVEIICDLPVDRDSEIISSYKGHNKVMNVTCFGEESSTDFYNTTITPISSGTIDFWLLKDEFSNVKLDKFFTVNRNGRIINSTGDGYIRMRSILLDEWTHFSMDFDLDSFDLYINGIQCADDELHDFSGSISAINFIVFNDFEIDDYSKANVTYALFDSIDFSWSSDYYQWKNYAWDYNINNLTYYSDLRADMVINTSISTDLRENVVDMVSHVTTFSFDFELVGTEDPNIDIEFLNIPDGLEIDVNSINDQSLQETVNFEITDIGSYEYGGIYFFEMNVTIDSDGSVIYFERIPFNIPVVESVSFEQDNIIYEENDISSGTYSSENSFTDDTDYTEPSGWTVQDYGAPPLLNIEVLPSLGGHSKVVEFWDHYGAGGASCYMYDSISDVENGTIEFWHRQSDVLKRFYTTLRNDNGDKFEMEVYNGYYRSDGENVFSISDDTWYKHQITFDCSDNLIQWTIGGILVYSGEFDTSTSVIDEFRFQTHDGDYPYEIYIDAVGYSWDDDYMIGDNSYETDTEITGISESQMEIGDIVNVEFKTNTYSEVLIKFINNDVLQNKYTLLPRGSGILRNQTKMFIINESITFDEIQFSSFNKNYFDVSEILIIDTYTSVSEPFNPVDITNNGNIPEYTTFTYMGEVEVETEGGGGGYVVSIEYVELTLSGVTSNSYTLTKGQDVSNCVPFVSMKHNRGDDWDELLVDVYFEESPSKVTGQRGEGTGTVVLSIYVVEFDGVNVEVQSGTFQITGTYDNVDITAIDQSKAFPLAYWRQSGNDDDWDCAMVTTDFVDDDTIRMEVDNSIGTINGHWYVVEAQNTEFSVDKYVLSMIGSADFDTETISLVDMDKTFIVSSYEADVGHDDAEEGAIDIWLNSDTQLRAERNPGAGSNSIPTINVFVIEFSGDETVQRGSFDWANADTTKSTDITAIDLTSSMIKGGQMYGIMECDGNGGDDGRSAFIQYGFADSDTVSAERYTNNEHGTGHWEVIEWVVGGELSYETKIIPVTEIIETLPGDNNEVSFDVNSTIENNINSRYIAWSSFSGENSFYMDNFSIDGIHISSPTNTIYNLIGNNLTCNKDEFVLNIIPEVTLTEMEYSLDGDTPVSFSGNTAKVPLPEIDGNYTIQVFGEDAGEIQYESEIRNFTIQYPIGIINPNETENTMFHEFTEDFDSFDNNSIGDEPNNWTVVTPNTQDTLYITDFDITMGNVVGTIANAQEDDENYFEIESQESGGNYYIICEIEFNSPTYVRDFFISYDIISPDPALDVELRLNGGSWKEGYHLDEVVFEEDVNYIGIQGFSALTPFTFKVYYFKMFDQTAEGNIEVVESMNGMSKPVELTNGNWQYSESSIERDLPAGYETGNITFSILRESITDKNIAMVTLSGTSGTLVLTLENNDLYNGTYASKDSLAANILKQDVWQEFVIFFNVSKGCQIFVDGINTTMPDEYVYFSTGTPTDIDTFKIETKYTSGEDYSFWFDNFLVNEIEGGFILDIYKRFISLDNLEYSFDEGAKKLFTNRELFSFPEDGLHNVTIYGTDFYGDEYRSEFKIFTTGTTFDVFEVSEQEQHEMPTRWSDFNHEYGDDGGIGGTGSMEYNDASHYTYVVSEMIPEEEFSELLRPDGPVSNEGWQVTPLWSKIDDAMTYPSTSGSDAVYVDSQVDTGDTTDYFRVDMDDQSDMGVNDKVSKIRVYVYGMATGLGSSNLKARYNLGDGWSSLSSSFGLPFGGDAWRYVDLYPTYGDYNRDDVDDLQIEFYHYLISPPFGLLRIQAAYIDVYFGEPIHRLTTEVTFTIPSEDLFSIDTLYYDYATTAEVLCTLDIWNYDDENYDTGLESDITTSYITGSRVLTDPYISESNQVKVCFETTTTSSGFNLLLDQLMVSYTKQVITLKEL